MGKVVIRSGNDIPKTWNRREALKTATVTWQDFVPGRDEHLITSSWADPNQPAKSGEPYVILQVDVPDDCYPVRKAEWEATYQNLGGGRCAKRQDANAPRTPMYDIPEGLTVVIETIEKTYETIGPNQIAVGASNEVWCPNQHNPNYVRDNYVFV